MIFVTVGTQFPFDRLIENVDLAIEMGLLKEPVFAQTGHSNYMPRYFNFVSHINKMEFDQYMVQSRFIISHAGMGSITSALEYRKPLLVMPRLKKYGEVVNDHQLHIAKEFEKDKYLVAAYDREEFFNKIQLLYNFEPRMRHTNEKQVKTRIAEFISSLR